MMVLTRKTGYDTFDVCIGECSEDRVPDAITSFFKAIDSASESGNSADDPETDYMNRLFAIHKMNMDYDAMEPVAIDPNNSNQFFILTHTKCRTWAQARVSLRAIASCTLHIQTDT